MGSSTRSSRATSALVALAVLAPAGTAHGRAEFLADCRLSHRAAADPIVHPGHRRAGHLHDFWGARRARRAPTSCAPRADRSRYWVPTLFAAGRAVRPSRITVYYSVEEELAAQVQPFPRSLRMIAGYGDGVVWNVLGTQRELLLKFPDCWDGRRSDSRDHRSHMAYSVAGVCPVTHSVAVPQIEFKILWPRGGSGATLASGSLASAHGDFMNGWSKSGLQRRIETCLRPVVKCDAAGQPL
jgi:hypothetical protein